MKPSHEEKEISVSRSILILETDYCYLMTRLVPRTHRNTPIENVQNLDASRRRGHVDLDVRKKRDSGTLEGTEESK